MAEEFGWRLPRLKLLETIKQKETSANCEQLCMLTIDHLFAVQASIMLTWRILRLAFPSKRHGHSGRCAGSFAVIGIDATNKTVEVKATLAPFAVFRAPWATISYTG